MLNFLGLLALDFVTFLLNGMVLKFLWGWFMVTTLHLPAVSLIQAIGIGLAISFITNQHIPWDDDQITQRIVYKIIAPFFALSFGWVFHQFM